MEKITKHLLLIVLTLSFLSVLTSVLVEQPEIKFADLNGAGPGTASRTVKMRVPAVDEEGNGVATELVVSMRPGEGMVLVDVNQLLFWVDTQHSIRTAKDVAQNITKFNLHATDLTYSIETNASLIGGPSAGAALTVATVALLENKSLNEEVVMTGTINPDGSIGQVGEILAKARASKDVGAMLFLVPVGQAVETTYKQVRNCENYGLIRYCTNDYLAEEIDVEKEAGIAVREVATVSDALSYLLK